MVAGCVFSGRFASRSLMHEAGCLIETWQLHTVVCARVYWQLQIAVKRTERTVYSLFSLKSRQHPSPVTERGGRTRGGVGSDRWRSDLNSEGIFCVKSLNTHHAELQKRNLGGGDEMIFSSSLIFFFFFLCVFFFSHLTPKQPLKHINTYTNAEQHISYSAQLQWPSCG